MLQQTNPLEGPPKRTDPLRGALTELETAHGWVFPKPFVNFQVASAKRSPTKSSTSSCFVMPIQEDEEGEIPTLTFQPPASSTQLFPPGTSEDTGVQTRSGSAGHPYFQNSSSFQGWNVWTQHVEAGQTPTRSTSRGSNVQGQETEGCQLCCVTSGTPRRGRHHFL